jgi:hypothetical protein
VVVVLWQRLIARSASVEARTPEMFVLGCSVWLAYSADRWIEGWRLAPDSIRTHRHLFHHKWRWPVAGVWVALLGLDLAVALRGLPAEEFRAGAFMLAPVAAYLLSHQLVHRNHRWRAPKEVCVALLLGGGTALFAASRPGSHPAGMAVPLALFVLLCFTNCALISVWEDEVDRSQGQTSLVTQFGGAALLSRALPWILFAICFAAWVVAGPRTEGAAACAAASSLLLGAVSVAEARMGRIRARVLADVALLTPLVPMLLRLFR